VATSAFPPNKVPISVALTLDSEIQTGPGDAFKPNHKDKANADLLAFLKS
jgi:hypothetical protein